MPLARDNTNLPKATPRRREDGWNPDPTPRFGSVLVEHWHAEGVERDAHFRDGEEDKGFWHSSAGSCSRAVAYAALGVAQSDPMDRPGHFVTRLGQIVHEAFQEVIPTRYPGARVEVSVGEGDFGGHVDTVIEEPAEPLVGDDPPWHRTIAVEVKSMGGFGYKLAVGERGPAQGPKSEHVIQVALNAKALDADEAVLVYLARDAISVQAARRRGFDEMLRVVAEWTLQRETYMPIAEREIERITAILGMVNSGVLPKRAIPDPELPAGHVITDPALGEWRVFDAEGSLREVGPTWHCAYCPWQTTCIGTAAGRQAISEVPFVIKGASGE